MEKFLIVAKKTLFSHNVFTLPIEITREWGYEKKGTFELHGKEYDVSLTGKHNFYDKDVNRRSKAFQAHVSEECGYELKKLFCHTFMALEDPDQLIESEEYVTVEFECINEDEVTFKVVEENIVVNPYTKYFKKLSDRNELALSTKHDVDIKHLINYSSSWMPIEELGKHTGTKKCIYMWIDMDKRYIYVGKANDLVDRIHQHQKTSQDQVDSIKKYGDTFKITHFRYDTVSSHIATDLLEALEMRSIQTVANLLPNNSSGNQRIDGLLENIGWNQINNQYSYH